MNRHFFFKVFTGPIIVGQTANLLRLHFADCEVLEGTERVWVHVFADCEMTVLKLCAGLPRWIQREIKTVNEFK